MQKDLLFEQLPRPKIGIRMLVDNRPALRAAQQKALCSLARQAAQLISTQVRYGDGSPAQCVISEIAVGNTRDAAVVSRQFRTAGVGAVISIARAWAYPSEVMEYDAQLPQAIWGFSGTACPGTVFMAAATATAEQRGVPVFKIYGRDMQTCDDVSIPQDVEQKLVSFARCALTVATLRGRTYVSIGGMCVGIGASALDHDFFNAYLDMRTQTVDTAEVLRRLRYEVYDGAEYARARKWVSAHCQEMEKDPNPEPMRQTEPEKQAAWDDSVKIALILRDMMQGNPNLARQGHEEEASGCLALAAGFQGQRHWTDWQVSSDFAETLLNSSFDWNGAKRPLSLATENDALQAVTMALGTLLTGTAQIFCDVRGYWSPEALEKRFGTVPEGVSDGFVYLTNSGPAALDGTMAACGPDHALKPFWEMGEKDAEACLAQTKWGAAKRAVFSGGGFSPSYQAGGGMPITMIRLNLIKGLGPVLQFVEGETVALPEDMARSLSESTDPTWMRLFFVPRLTQQYATQSVYNVIDKWGSNHCTLCSGHCGSLLITLASMLRIPVCMHNLPQSALFRPTVWNMFGQDGGTEADFRACATYGPLYGKY